MDFDFFVGNPQAEAYATKDETSDLWRVFSGHQSPVTNHQSPHYATSTVTE